MDIEEKTELPAEVVAERERIRLAALRFADRVGYRHEIQQAWAAIYPGVDLYTGPDPGDVSEAVLAERRRVAHEVVELSRRYRWCNESQRVWRNVMPGVEFRDKDGYDCDGYDRNGKHRMDVDPSTRPPQPEGTEWCAQCRKWERAA